jgi:hypothetical protein
MGCSVSDTSSVVASCQEPSVVAIVDVVVVSTSVAAEVPVGEAVVEAGTTGAAVKLLVGVLVTYSSGADTALGCGDEGADGVVVMAVGAGTIAVIPSDIAGADRGAAAVVTEIVVRSDCSAAVVAADVLAVGDAVTGLDVSNGAVVASDGPAVATDVVVLGVSAMLPRGVPARGFTMGK